MRRISAGRDGPDREDLRLVRDLAHAMAAGERTVIDTAFEAIWRRHVRPVALVCARYLSDDGDILSVADDVFVRFFRAVPSLELTTSLRAYLAAIARHAALDHLRSVARREAHMTDIGLSPDLSHDGDGGDRLSLLPDPDADLGASLRYRELVCDLRSVLPAETVELILAHAVWGMSFGEIGRRLGRRENSVKTTYHRALATFRRQKGEHWL